jgi:hypothetical protein
MAAVCGHVDIVKLLIDAGASLELSNDFSQTAQGILQVRPFMNELT